MVFDELEQVGIAGDDQHAEALFAGAMSRKTADHVIGFIAGPHFNRNVERIDKLLDAVDLSNKIVGGLRSVRLVLLRCLVPEGAAPLERDDRVIRFLSVDDVKEHPGKSEHGVGLLAFGGGHARIDCVVGAEDQSEAVYQHDCWTFSIRRHRYPPKVSDKRV